MFGSFRLGRDNQGPKGDHANDGDKFYVKRGHLAVKTSKLVDSPRVQEQLEVIKRVPLAKESSSSDSI